MFDAPWSDGEGGLVAQEEVQNELYRLLNNFVRQRRIDRLILLHGPNGSSKSTVTEMFSRAMEHYSTQDAGALYRFNWVFPTRAQGRKGIGFHSSDPDDSGESYAHGHNIEVFNSGDYSYCEAEWHSPSQRLRPGGEITFTQRFEISTDHPAAI